MEPVSIIACDVFEQELELLLGSTESLRFLEMGLHDRPELLREQIQSLISDIENHQQDGVILLVYGLCGNALSGIVATHNRLVIPRVHDCISILLGSEARHREIMQEDPGTYFYSPGWVRGKRVPGPDRDAHVRAFYSERYGDDPDMIEDLVEADREAFCAYHCAAYVEVFENPEARSYCENCAKNLGWSYRSFQGDLSFMKDLIAGRWADDLFIVNAPGEALQMGAFQVGDDSNSTIQGLK